MLLSFADAHFDAAATISRPQLHAIPALIARYGFASRPGRHAMSSHLHEMKRCVFRGVNVAFDDFHDSDTCRGRLTPVLADARVDRAIYIWQEMAVIARRLAIRRARRLRALFSCAEMPPSAIRLMTSLFDGHSRLCAS